MKRKAILCWLGQYLFWNWCELGYEMSFSQFVNELLMNPFRFVCGFVSFIISFLLLAGMCKTVRLRFYKKSDHLFTFCGWLCLFVILYACVAYLSVMIATSLFLSAYIYDMIDIYDGKGKKMK